MLLNFPKVPDIGGVNEILNSGNNNKSEVSFQKI